jgi:type IV secretory pathway VirB6-like protein
MQSDEYKGGFVDRDSGSVCTRLTLDPGIPLTKPYACNAGPGSPPITSQAGVMTYVYDFTKCKVESATQQIYNTISSASWYRNSVAACVLLSIALFSLTVMVGIHSFQPWDIVANLLRIGAVYYLGTNWGNFSMWVSGFFETFIVDIGGRLAQGFAPGTSATPGAGNAVGFMDNIFSQLISYNTGKIFLALLLTGGSGVGYAAMFMVMIFSYLWGLLKAAYVLLITLVGRNLMYALAPMFMVFLLFNRTRSMFEGWIKQLISFSLKPVMIFAVLGFMYNIYSVFYGSLIASGIANAVCYEELWAMPGKVVTLNWWFFEKSNGGTIEGPASGPPMDFYSLAVLTIIAFMMRHMFTWGERLAVDLAQAGSIMNSTLIGWATAKAAMMQPVAIAGAAVGGGLRGAFNKQSATALWRTVTFNQVANNLGILSKNIFGGALKSGVRRGSPTVIRDKVLAVAAKDFLGISDPGKYARNLRVGRNKQGGDITKENADEQVKRQKKEQVDLKKEGEKAKETIEKEAKKKNEEAVKGAATAKTKEYMEKTAEEMGKDGDATAARAALALAKKEGEKIDQANKQTLEEVEAYTKEQQEVLRTAVKEQEGKRREEEKQLEGSAKTEEAALQQSQEKRREVTKLSDKELERKEEKELADLQKKQSAKRATITDPAKLDELKKEEESALEALKQLQQKRRADNKLTPAELTKLEKQETEALKASIAARRQGIVAKNEQEIDQIRRAHSDKTANGVKAIMKKRDDKIAEARKSFEDGIRKQQESRPQTVQRMDNVRRIREDYDAELARANASDERAVAGVVFETDKKVVDVTRQEEAKRDSLRKAHKAQLEEFGVDKRYVEEAMKELDKTDKELNPTKGRGEVVGAGWLGGENAPPAEPSQTRTLYDDMAAQKKKKEDEDE